MVWIVNTEIGLDSYNSVIKRLLCSILQAAPAILSLSNFVFIDNFTFNSVYIYTLEV